MLSVGTTSVKEQSTPKKESTVKHLSGLGVVSSFDHGDWTKKRLSPTWTPTDFLCRSLTQVHCVELLGVAAWHWLIKKKGVGNMEIANISCCFLECFALQVDGCQGGVKNPFRFFCSVGI